jgi:hypothetical protein
VVSSRRHRPPSFMRRESSILRHPASEGSASNSRGPSPLVSPLLYLHPTESGRISINLSPDLRPRLKVSARREGWTFAPSPEVGESPTLPYSAIC